MSLRRYEDEIYDVLTTDFDLNTEVKNEDDRVILRANCSIDALEDEDILLSVTVFDNEEAFVTFTLDKLYEDEESLELINAVNREQKVFQACIDDEGYVVLSHYVYNAGGAAMFADTVKFCLNKFVSDLVLELLEPICELTE